MKVRYVFISPGANIEKSINNRLFPVLNNGRFACHYNIILELLHYLLVSQELETTAAFSRRTVGTFDLREFTIRNGAIVVV